MAYVHEGLASLGVDLHEVGNLLALTNSLVHSTSIGGSQVTPNQSRRHHSPKGNRWGCDDELLALVLQKIVSSTLKTLSQDLAMWEERDLGGKQLRWLEIKVLWLEWKAFDLNTRIWSSLSEKWIWEV